MPESSFTLEHQTLMDADTKKRKEELEEYIKKTPYSSTAEKERLKEIEDAEEEERKRQSGPGEVLY